MRIINRIITKVHTLETTIEANSYQRKDVYQIIVKNSETTSYKGSYDPSGFRSYLSKNQTSHFKPLLTEPELKISSVGVGTYKGSLDEQDDLLMFNGLVESLNNGCNVLDSCRNFRGGRS